MRLPLPTWRATFLSAFAVIFVAAGSVTWAQTPLGIDLAATITGPNTLRLDWTGYGSAVTSQKLFRRDKGATSWGTAITLANSANTYTDTVTPGVEVEYRLEMIMPTQYNGSGYGYLSAGIGIPAVEQRGRILVLVDETLAPALAPDLEQLDQDLTGDGWTVQRVNVPRMAVDPATTGTAVGPARLAEVQNIRNIIASARAADPAGLKLVYLIGRVPIPYSGLSALDGHSDHSGAWPADTYYADVDETWTDSIINSSSATDPRNRNVPGDGKFDNDEVAAAELGVGRVDLSNMTVFPDASVSEVDLIRRYLQRANEFRHVRGRYAAIERRAVVIPIVNESSSMEGSIVALLGRGSSLVDRPSTFVSPGPWFHWMESNPGRSYLMGLAQGGGSSTGIGTIGTSTDFGLRPSRAVFIGMLGSYLGDWGYNNNFLRAALAGNAAGDSLALATFWTGRPMWYLHAMGMGETIGEIARQTMNNTSANYNPPGQFGVQGRHIGLMGDPALRLRPVAPPRNLRATGTGSAVSLAWDASTDPAVSAYRIYRSSSAAGPFTRVDVSPVTATSFTDTNAPAGAVSHYMVRAVKNETHPGGSHVNLSQGLFTRTAPESLFPATPGNFTATYVTANRVDLSWADLSNDETGFRIERRTGVSGNFTTVATVGAGVQTVSDTQPLTVGTPVYYRIVATGSAGESAPSPVASVEPRIGFLDMASRSVVGNLANGTVDIPVTRIGGRAGAVSVQFSTSNGTALAGQHYQATSGNLTWADGEDGVKMARVPLLSTSPSEPRVFSVTLGSATGNATLTSRISADVVITDPAAAISSPWVSTTLSTVSDPGATGRVGGNFTSVMRGGDWMNSYETGRFIYQSGLGDGTLTARLEAPTPMSPSSAGSVAIMVRDRLDSTTGRMAAVRIPVNGSDARLFVRSTSWATPTQLPGTATNNPLPRWVRITRAGNTFTGEISADGVTWTTLGSASIADMPPTVHWGLFHCSSLATFQTARFSSVNLQGVLDPNNPSLHATTVTVSGGNGNAILDRNEAANLSIAVRNLGGGGATGVTATLTSNTSGVTVLEPTRSYPNIAANATASPTQPFVVDVAPDIPNWASASFTLTIANSVTTEVRTVTVPLSQMNYTRTTSSNGTILTGGTRVTGTGISTRHTLALPFPFTFYGITQNAATATSRGVLEFPGSSSTVISSANAALPSNLYGSAALPFWDGLEFSRSHNGLFTQVSGTAPSRIFHIEWNLNFTTLSTGTNFEVRLHETTNVVEFVYGSNTGNGSGATSGIQGPAGSADQFSHNQAVLVPGLVVRFTPNAPPQGNGRPDTDNDGLPDWWTMQKFGTRTGNAISQSRAMDAPAGDGVPNLIKYALGLEPLQSGMAGRMSSNIQQVAGSDYLTLTYTRPEPAPFGVSYVVEASSTLAPNSWSPVGTVELSSTVSNGLRTITVRDAAPANGTRFLRLRIQRP